MIVAAIVAVCGLFGLLLLIAILFIGENRDINQQQMRFHAFEPLARGGQNELGSDDANNEDDADLTLVAPSVFEITRLADGVTVSVSGLLQVGDVKVRTMVPGGTSLTQLVPVLVVPPGGVTLAVFVTLPLSAVTVAFTRS